MMLIAWLVIGGITRAIDLRHDHGGVQRPAPHPERAAGLVLPRD